MCATDATPRRKAGVAEVSTMNEPLQGMDGSATTNAANTQK